jgi:cytochrome c-type biogenesis protein CcmH/NrfF
MHYLRHYRVRLRRSRRLPYRIARLLLWALPLALLLIAQAYVLAQR